MRVLYFLADTFIDTFGITRPDASGRKRAALFILGLLALLTVGVAAVGVLLHMLMR